MLTLTNRRNNKQTVFKNYEKLYGHIAYFERIRQRPNAPKPLKRWAFSCHSFARILTFHEYVLQRLPKGKAALEAIRHECDVLEICCGDSLAPQLIPVTPDMSIATFKAEWCRLYCQTHGYELTETVAHDLIK
jgi:hypothetical protein